LGHLIKTKSKYNRYRWNEMKKIKDRMILGVIGGVAGNIFKLVIDGYFKKKKIAEIDGPERAAGMLVPPHTVTTKEGRIVGYLADGAVASLLGVSLVYLFSLTGKNRGVLKGAATGQAMWTFIYGVLGTMGATKVTPVSPKTVLTEYLAHTAYGIVTASTILAIGDERLFNGNIPLFPGTVKIKQNEPTHNETNLAQDQQLIKSSIHKVKGI